MINTGYYCCDDSGKCGCTIACKWKAQTTPYTYGNINNKSSTTKLLQFTTENGESILVTPDGCNCISPYTVAIPNVKDPYTGQIGYACQLTEKGEADLALGNYGKIYKTYLDRSTGKISCFTTTGCRTNNYDSLIPC